MRVVGYSTASSTQADTEKLKTGNLLMESFMFPVIMTNHTLRNNPASIDRAE